MSGLSPDSSQRTSLHINRFRHPGRILATQALFLLNTVIWISFGIVTLIRMANGVGSQVGWILAILMFGNAAIMFFFGWGIARWTDRFWVLAIAFLVLNILLTITDQIGLIDLATLLIDLVLAVLVVVGRLVDRNNTRHGT